MLVDVVDALQDLMYTVAGISFAVVFSGHDVFKQLPSRNKVKHEVVKPFFRNTVMETHDVWMFQKSAYPGLSF